MAVGDRLQNPVSPQTGAGYAIYEVTDETAANGSRQAAMLVKQVDDDGNTVTPGALTNLEKSEDAAHVSGDKGIMALGVRNDANASLSGTNGDYTPISVDAAGNPQVDVLTLPALPSGSNTIGAAQDAGPSWTTSRGVSGATVTSADMSGAAANITDAPTAGQKIVLDDLEISVDTAMRVDIKEETSGTVVGSYYMAANSTVQLTWRGKKKLATADKTVQAQTSAAGNVRITAGYHSEA